MAGRTAHGPLCVESSGRVPEDSQPGSDQTLRWSVAVDVCLPAPAAEHGRAGFYVFSTEESAGSPSSPGSAAAKRCAPSAGSVRRPGQKLSLRALIIRSYRYIDNLPKREEDENCTKALVLRQPPRPGGLGQRLKYRRRGLGGPASSAHREPNATQICWIRAIDRAKAWPCASAIHQPTSLFAANAIYPSAAIHRPLTLSNLPFVLIQSLRGQQPRGQEAKERAVHVVQ